MNGGGKSEVWSPRQWFVAVVGVLVAQFLLVFALCQTGFSEESAIKRPVPARMAMVMGGAQEERILSELGMTDPSLFAVAHRSGLSARGSVVRPASAPELSSLLEPPNWLQGGPALLEPPSPPPKSENPGWKPAAAVVERPASDFSSLGGGTNAAVQETRVRLGGGLSKREVLSGRTAPLLSAPQVVRSSVVQVGVDAAGTVLSVRLVDSSGWPAADQEALKHARRMRFQRGAEANRTSVLDWGTVSFSWANSEAPAMTNRFF